MIINNNFKLLMLMFILTACGHENEHAVHSANNQQAENINKNVSDTTVTTIENRQSESPNVHHEFSCLNSSITSMDTITLLLPDHYPLGLAIEDMNHAYYILFYPMNNDSEKNLYLSKVNGQFQLKIPATATGTIYIEGQKFTKKVFTSPGKYKILVADNLETELDNTYYFTCDVHFKK